ncbi:hypothetical protein ES703_109936 [subsurface metagenome]
MSQLRLAKETDLRSFPGCHSVVVDTPPIAQCQETEIVAPTADTVNGQYTVEKTGAFAGIDLAGKEVVITNSTADDGTYTIISNTDDVLTTDHQFATTESLATATCHDAGQAYLTRNEASFVRFVESLGNAHTFLNGQLYTDVATGPLSAACSDTYEPD